MAGLSTNGVLTTPKKPQVLQRLLESAEKGNVNWQALLRGEEKVTKALGGAENFDEYLNAALTGKNGGNFI